VHDVARNHLESGRDVVCEIDERVEMGAVWRRLVEAPSVWGPVRLNLDRRAVLDHDVVGSRAGLARHNAAGELSAQHHGLDRFTAQDFRLRGVIGQPDLLVLRLRHGHVTSTRNPHLGHHVCMDVRGCPGRSRIRRQWHHDRAVIPLDRRCRRCSPKWGTGGVLTRHFRRSVRHRSRRRRRRSRRGDSRVRSGCC